MLNGPRGAPVNATMALLSQPEFGAARKIQAIDPRNAGVTNAANTSERISPRPGISVRVVAQRPLTVGVGLEAAGEDPDQRHEDERSQSEGGNRPDQATQV